MSKRLGFAWLYTAKIKPMPRKQIVSFWLRLVALHHIAACHNDTSNAARLCFSRYVATRSIAAP